MARFIAKGKTDDQEYKIACGSSGGLQGPGTVPYFFLIDAEGKVVHQGGQPSEKLIKETLKTVPKATPEAMNARAEKALAWAEDLVGKKRFAEAIDVLDRVVKDKDYAGTEAVKKATERKSAIEKDEAAKVELEHQKKIATILGNPERPAAKMKGKEQDAAVKRLEMVQKEAEKAGATAAVELAQYWVKAMADEKK